MSCREKRNQSLVHLERRQARGVCQAIGVTRQLGHQWFRADGPILLRTVLSVGSPDKVDGQHDGKICRRGRSRSKGGALEVFEASGVLFTDASYRPGAGNG